MNTSPATRRYLVLGMIIVLCAILMSGTVVYFSLRYYDQARRDLLLANASLAADATVSSYYQYGNLTGAGLPSEYKRIKNSIGAVLFLADAKGNIVIRADSGYITSGALPPSVVETLGDGLLYVQGDLDEFLTQRCFIAAVPVTLGKSDVYHAFVAMPGEDILRHRSRLSNLLMGIFVFALAAVFFVSNLFSERLNTPLGEMSKAVRAFGKGELTSQIKVPKDRKLAELATELNEMARSLSSTEQMRRSFIANVSHELKTPMTTIAGFVDGIMDGTIPKEKQAQYLRTISDEVKRLSRLVRSMLDSSQIEAGERSIHYTSFNIVDLTIDVTLLFENSISLKNADVRGLNHEPILIEADRDMLHQVVYNLCENAVKFVDDGGYIRYDWQIDGDTMRMSVKNSGQGIDQDDLPRLFDRFYKTEKSRGQDKTGVGLGLYIVRSIIHLHGGEITVQSKPGEYAEFIFSIPLKRPSETDPTGRQTD